MPDPTVSEERGALLSSPQNQRSHVLASLQDLGEDDLRRPVLPTGWTCLGLVQHLAVDVERFWFRAVMAGQPGLLSEANAWQVSPETPAGAVLDLYRQETELASGIIAATPLDAAPAWRPEDQFGNWRLHNLRQIILHVITETACHAGHLDAVRELIDGHTWLILTD